MKWIPLAETVLGGPARNVENAPKTAPEGGASDRNIPRAPAGPAAGNPPDSTALAAEYRAGRGIGVVTLGEKHFFFRRLMTVYYLPYGSISRYFRRVMAVPAKLGCCAGEVRVEHLVVCAASASDGAERELAQIQLPGEKAARALMEELPRLAPNAAAGRPDNGGRPPETEAGHEHGGASGQKGAAS